jgi:3-hydroxybutyryl-CoA dehydrogenase
VANCKHLQAGHYHLGMKVQRVGIVGSGIMGAGVAEVVAKAGFEAILVSRSKERAAHAEAMFQTSLQRQLDRGKLSAADHDATLGRFEVTNSMDQLAGCDLIIESIVEDLALKREMFAHIDQICAPHAILSTNTSTLPVVELAMRTKRPDQVCGIHFFNPAPVMPLIEIVQPLTASDATISIAADFAKACGKDAVIVKDRAGFVVNALLFPYLNNAVRLLENGVASRDDIDKAMKGGCGFPMGPFALLDLVGLDTSVAILDALYEETRDAHMAPQPLLRRMVTAGHLGRKSGRGFFEYSQATHNS